MNTHKTAVHFADPYLLQPTNPVSVYLIGAGGTGSEMLRKLGRMNEAMNALGHPGLQVTLIDDDRVSEANLVRQEFGEAELGMHKAVALINRINEFHGTNWKAAAQRFTSTNCGRLPDGSMANLYISCTDTVSSRFDIAKTLNRLPYQNYRQTKPLYWMDLGNSRYTGQAILSTITDIQQPASEKFRTVALLPMVTDEFFDLLEGQQDNGEPSCSAAEALQKQDLFVNPAIALYGAELLWQLMRNGMTEYRGIFMNLQTMQTQPLKVA
jgi:PRTRC genetic system ThiF family protein